MISNIEWGDTIKKEARESYDGSVLRFTISEDEIKSKYMSDMPPPPSSFTKPTSSRIQRSEDNNKDFGQVEEGETKVPLSDEKMNVSKHTQESQVKVTKEPIKETKTVQVQ